jgi:hypothetical protein
MATKRKTRSKGALELPIVGRTTGTIYAYWPFPVIGKLTASEKAMLGPTREELLKQKRLERAPDALL